MIMINSKSGQRLARAKYELIQASKTRDQAWLDALDNFDEAATLLAEELMADGHHLAEDY